MTPYDILNKSGLSPTFHLLDVLALYPVRHAADIPLMSLQVCHFGVPPCGEIPAQLGHIREGGPGVLPWRGLGSPQSFPPFPQRVIEIVLRSSYQKTYNNYKNAVRGENLYRRQTRFSTEHPPLVVSKRCL